MSNTVLQMHNITKIYGSAKALNDVSLEIKQGDIYGLIGNNGAGKTTIMRIIAGQTFADLGSFDLFGVSDKTGIRQARRRIGTLIESPGFFSDLTASQNLEYFRIQFGVPGKAVTSQLLDMVGLGTCGKKAYRNFSLGMQQRLGIALALLQNPEFLILDEPINGLDPEGIIEIRNTLNNINQKSGTTILISSHILAEMSNIATKYGFLDHGRMLEEIDAETLNRKCSNYLDIAVKDSKKMCRLLEAELGYSNYKVYPDGHIHLYEGLDDGERICETAVLNHTGLTGIDRKTVNLENYYMDLINK